MNRRRLFNGTVVGGVCMFALGWLIFDMIFGGFYDANASDAASAVVREVPILWAWVLGSLGLAVLVTIAIDWAGAESFAQGFRVGGIVGFLAWFGVDFITYSLFDLQTISVIVLDPFLEIVRTGLVGGIISVLLAKSSQSGAAPEPAVGG